MADTFTIQKLQWLRQVAADPSLPPQALRLAVVLACDFVNRQSREAWPSVPTLEDLLGKKENAIRSASDALVAAGHMTVKVGGGRKNPSRYRWVIREENPSAGGGVSDEKPLQDRQGFGSGNPSNPETETPSFSERNPSVSGGKTPPKMKGEPFEENPMKEPYEGTPSSGAVSRIDPASPFGHDHEAAQAFQAVWTRWPKKTGRADAEKAMAEVLRQGAIWEDVARGAAAYVADRQRDNRGAAAIIQYTKPLARWLREGEWETWQLLPDAEAQAESALEALWREQDEISAAIRAGNPF